MEEDALEEARQALEWAVAELEDIESEEREKLQHEQWRFRRNLTDLDLLVAEELWENSNRNQLTAQEVTCWEDICKQHKDGRKQLEQECADDILEQELAEFERREGNLNKIESEHWELYEEITTNEETVREGIKFQYQYGAEKIQAAIDARNNVEVAESSARASIQQEENADWHKLQEFFSGCALLGAEEAEHRMAIGQEWEQAVVDLVQWEAAGRNRKITSLDGWKIGFTKLDKECNRGKQQILRDEKFEWNLMIDLMKEKITANF
eukprot:TRINITY_DN68099_c4_g1_i1.p1 TRINITY_DN68099_c4_g1~~TRINITY_DN68099_c4_g1_i1.p1  ORF type:complete len:312 (-),score=57.85 TRINITY_DN68099_c4_g1_i1:75-875(-)